MKEEADESIYDEEGKEELVDDSEISPEEAGFMMGYNKAADEKEQEDDDSKKEEEE